MIAASRRMRRARLAIVAAGLLGAAGASRGRAPEAEPSPPAPQCDPLSAEASRGRAIFRKGTLSSGKPLVGALGGGDVTLSGREAACATCHGPAGTGTEEGGVAAPPITPEALFSPAGAQNRGAYTAEALATAIGEGRTPLPRELGPTMPRFRLEPAEMADLVAYLRCLGHDRDPGVSADEIRIGAALPLSGPLAERGAGVRAALATHFESVNAQGGVFGRRLALLVEDSAEAGEKAALERLTHAGVFALVGSVWSGAPEVDALLRAEEMPLLGPVAAGRAAKDGERVFHVQPGPEVLARVALKYLAQARPEARVWLVHTRDAAGDRWAEGARLEASRRGMALAGAIPFAPGAFEPARLREIARESGEAAILFSCSARELVAAALAVAPWKGTRIHAPAWLLAELAEDQRNAVAGRVLFVHPGLVGEQASAYVAARLAVEALKRAGAAPTRAGLVRALEELHDFESGLVPALSYGKNRRVGVMGAWLVQVDAPSARIRAVSDWIEVTP